VRCTIAELNLRDRVKPRIIRNRQKASKHRTVDIAHQIWDWECAATVRYTVTSSLEVYNNIAILLLSISYYCSLTACYRIPLRNHIVINLIKKSSKFSVTRNCKTVLTADCHWSYSSPHPRHIITFRSIWILSSDLPLLLQMVFFFWKYLPKLCAFLLLRRQTKRQWNGCKYVMCSFYRCPEHRICHVIFYRIQASYAINRSCSVRWWKKHPVACMHTDEHLTYTFSLKWERKRQVASCRRGKKNINMGGARMLIDLV
jgi:hypothetical protein